MYYTVGRFTVSNRKSLIVENDLHEEKAFVLLKSVLQYFYLFPYTNAAYCFIVNFMQKAV